MTNPLVEQLRRDIDDKHAQAIQALETLAVYLSSPALPTGNRATQKPRKPGPRAGKGKIRNRVLDAFRTDYKPVREVVKETGLETRQVRGVLTAPDLKGQFAKKDVDGLTFYKFEGEAE